MEYIYKTKGTCSSKIKFNIDNGVITDVEFTGGCNGNLQAIAKLIDGLTVDEIERKCSGILCGNKATSCADQLARAVRCAYEKSTK